MQPISNACVICSIANADAIVKLNILFRCLAILVSLCREWCLLHQRLPQVSTNLQWIPRKNCNMDFHCAGRYDAARRALLDASGTITSIAAWVWSDDGPRNTLAVPGRVGSWNLKAESLAKLLRKLPLESESYSQMTCGCLHDQYPGLRCALLCTVECTPVGAASRTQEPLQYVLLTNRWALAAIARQIRVGDSLSVHTSDRMFSHSHSFSRCPHCVHAHNERVLVLQDFQVVQDDRHMFDQAESFTQLPDASVDEFAFADSNALGSMVAQVSIKHGSVTDDMQFMLTRGALNDGIGVDYHRALLGSSLLPPRDARVCTANKLNEDLRASLAGMLLSIDEGTPLSPNPTAEAVSGHKRTRPNFLSTAQESPASYPSAHTGSSSNDDVAGSIHMAQSNPVAGSASQLPFHVTQQKAPSYPSPSLTAQPSFLSPVSRPLLHVPEPAMTSLKAITQVFRPSASFLSPPLPARFPPAREAPPVVDSLGASLQLGQGNTGNSPSLPPPLPATLLPSPLLSSPQHAATPAQAPAPYKAPSTTSPSTGSTLHQAATCAMPGTLLLSDVVSRAHTLKAAKTIISVMCIVLDGTFSKPPAGKAKDCSCKLMVTDASLISQAIASRCLAKMLPVMLFSAAPLNVFGTLRVGDVLLVEKLHVDLHNGEIQLVCGPRDGTVFSTFASGRITRIPLGSMRPYPHTDASTAMHLDYASKVQRASAFYCDMSAVFVGTEYAQQLESLPSSSRGYVDVIACVAKCNPVQPLGGTQDWFQQGGSGTRSSSLWIWDGTGHTSNHVGEHPLPTWASCSLPDILTRCGREDRAAELAVSEASWSAGGALVEVELSVADGYAIATACKEDTWIRLRNVSLLKKTDPKGGIVCKLYVNATSGLLRMPEAARCADVRLAMSRYLTRMGFMMEAVGAVEALQDIHDAQTILLPSNCHTEVIVTHTGGHMGEYMAAVPTATGAGTGTLGAPAAPGTSSIGPPKHLCSKLILSLPDGHLPSLRSIADIKRAATCPPGTYRIQGRVKSHWPTYEGHFTRVILRSHPLASSRTPVKSLASTGSTSPGDTGTEATCPDSTGATPDEASGVFPPLPSTFENKDSLYCEELLAFPSTHRYTYFFSLLLQDESGEHISVILLGKDAETFLGMSPSTSLIEDDSAAAIMASTLRRLYDDKVWLDCLVTSYYSVGGETSVSPTDAVLRFRMINTQLQLPA
jgi:hypothetical protein